MDDETQAALARALLRQLLPGKEPVDLFASASAESLLFDLT
jgi:hypothetical protein